MERRVINALIVNDDDLDCKKGINIDIMNLASLGFVLGDLSKFDLIVYKGSKGEKILKSKYFSQGKIVK